MLPLQITFRVRRINNAYFGKYLHNKSVKSNYNFKKKTGMSSIIIITRESVLKIHQFALAESHISYKSSRIEIKFSLRGICLEDVTLI